MSDRRSFSLLLVAPALAVVLALFVYPLCYSLVSAFTARNGELSLENFAKTFDLYGTDIVFTVVIVTVSTALIGLFAAAIGGYLVLGAHPAAVTFLKWLYRWPLFIPFIVAAQCMRTFLAKNGMLNNALDTLGLVDVAGLPGLLDWRGSSSPSYGRRRRSSRCWYRVRWPRWIGRVSKRPATSAPAACVFSSTSSCRRSRA
jgi:putative spermidine/putrescine transport system permease protein